jgi:type II secretory ATPase GspE/PulE/Tfp pilus assembly ATPase PilB-like protein
VQASLTGHLVFSTLHTNDAPGAITRLVDMGIEPFLVASSLEMVMAQRLVRLICPQCREQFVPPDLSRLRADFGEQMPEKLYHGTGCRHCHGTGYRGRLGIFELMPVTETLRTMIVDRASASDLRKAAVRSGMRSLREDGWRLIRAGKTTVEEVLRATKEELGGGNGNGNGKGKENGPPGQLGQPEGAE